MKSFLLLIATLFAGSAFAAPSRICFRNDGHYLVDAWIIITSHYGHVRTQNHKWTALPIAQERCIDFDNSHQKASVYASIVWGPSHDICSEIDIRSTGKRVMMKGDLVNYWCDVEKF